jgi:hypothetical protein
MMKTAHTLVALSALVAIAHGAAHGGGHGLAHRNVNTTGLEGRGHKYSNVHATWFVTGLYVV